MGSYFKSKDVEVYPCSYRGTYIDDKSQTKQLNPKARMLTEDGITRIGGAARLADNYVVNSSETVLEVVLAGYYFKISNLNDNNYSLANCYLNINTLDITTSGEKQRILDSLDSTTEGILDSGEYFTGLSYSLDKEGKVSFKVFDNDGNVLDSAYLPAYDTEFGTFKIHGNSVSGKRSAAFGTGTDTNKENQFVVGSYNETSSSSQFIVGNGTSDNRKNVFETGSGTTLINEDAKVSGKLEVEGALIAKKNITVGEHLVVSGDISGSSKLNIEGAATFSDSLKIGKTDDDYNVKIEKSGRTTLADIAVFNNKGIDLKQDVNADKNVFIAGTCNISGANEILQLTSSKIISKNSGLTINAITVTEEGDVTAKDITANGTLTAKKTLTVNGTGDSSFKGAVTAKSGKTETPNSTNNHVALLSDLLDLIYPVGSIYTADAKTYDQKESSLVCPIATKLGGTWTLIENTFLHCESQQVGTSGAYKGGSDAAYLVTHSHTYDKAETTSTQAKRNGENSDNDLVGTIFLPSGEFESYTCGIMDNSKGDGVNNWEPKQTDCTDWVTQQPDGSAQKWNGIITFRDGKHNISKSPYSFKYSRVMCEMDLWSTPYAASPITIDARHEHKLPLIKTSGSTSSINNTANMPAYQKVYAWVRTK